MDKFDRIYALHGIFSTQRYPVAMPVLCEKLECSISCIKRLLGEMKDLYGWYKLEVTFWCLKSVGGNVCVMTKR